MTARRSLLLAALLAAAQIAPTVTATAADSAPTLDQAVALLKAGQRDEALHALDAILARHPPDPSPALFYAGRINLENGDWRAARPLVQRLVKLRPNLFAGWEMMIQIDQAAGSIAARNDAIESLYESWHTAIDPAVQARVSFVRERLAGPKHTLLAQQTLEEGGDDIVRFVFQPVEESGNARHFIIVRSDNETNQRWREDGTVPFGTVIYHLDTVEQLPNGRANTRPYQYFTEPPDYDKIRIQVLAILNGSIKPLSGEADPYWTTDSAGR